MDTPIVISLGTIVAIIGMFYAWHKDSRETAKQIQKLETEVEQLKEHKEEIRELGREIGSLKTDINSINQTLARIDTNVTHLMQDR